MINSCVSVLPPFPHWPLWPKSHATLLWAPQFPVFLALATQPMGPWLSPVLEGPTPHVSTPLRARQCLWVEGYGHEEILRGVHKVSWDTSCVRLKRCRDKSGSPCITFGCFGWASGHSELGQVGPRRTVTLQWTLSPREQLHPRRWVICGPRTYQALGTAEFSPRPRLWSLLWLGHSSM